MATMFSSPGDKKETIRFLTGVRHDGVDYGPGHDGGEVAEIEAIAARRYVAEGRAEYFKGKPSAAK
jgi:hypothetical protein